MKKIETRSCIVSIAHLTAGINMQKNASNYFLNFLRENLTTGKKVFILSLIFPFNALAIEFTTSTAVRWTTLKIIDAGCIAQIENNIHNNIFIGQCNQEDQPVGRGIFFKDKQLLLVRLHQGKIISTRPYIDQPEMDDYADHARFIAAYHSVFLSIDNFNKEIPAPTDSERFQLASKYLQQYAERNSDYRTAIQNMASASKKAAFDHGMVSITKKRSSQVTSKFIQTWVSTDLSNKLDDARRLEIEHLAFESQERERLAKIAAERDQAERLDAQNRYEARQRLIPTSCNNFYPGFVGNYKCGGFFCTADRFVIRYVNKDQHTVTIEGNSSGNSLSVGKLMEMPCLDLIEGMR